MTDKQNLEYAIRLATILWEKYYKNTAPHWKPFDDMSGVLSQIDNMIAGIMMKDGRLKDNTAAVDELYKDACDRADEFIGKLSFEFYFEFGSGIDRNLLNETISRVFEVAYMEGYYKAKKDMKI